MGLVAAWPALAVAAFALVTTPHAPWRVLGPLSAALLAGLVVRGVREHLHAAPGEREDAGLRILATTVLRAGVVLSALRLDWSAIAHAGPRPWLVALAAVLGGMLVFAVLLRRTGEHARLAALIAIGTSVCGAAAITAAAPRLGARDDEVTRGIAIISVLGAALSVALVLAHAWLGLPDAAYALVAGGALHEVAHVAAAAGALPELAGLALLTKLARVALLPLGLALVTWVARTPQASGAGRRGVPGLAVAFFAATLVGSIPGWLPGLPADALATWHAVRGALLQVANAALALAMAAIGLRLAPRALLATDRGVRRIALLGAGAVLALVTGLVVGISI
jgi:uncharacterized integral membrane protein (TIGR00698 family)